MRITQWGEYATHFCIYFARIAKESANKTVTATEIAEAHDIDQLYAQQILQRLRKGNLILSTRGAHGGYHLSRPAKDISLRQILAAAEGETFEVICDSKPIDGTRCASGFDCSVRGIWQDLKTHIDDYLETKTLEDLSSSHNVPALDPKHLTLINAKRTTAAC